MKPYFSALIALMPFICFAQEEETEEQAVVECAPEKKICAPDNKWYFEVKPGYLYFTDGEMRSFFNNGGFTCRGEVGCKFWGPLIVWVDGGYFQKDGQALGGTETLKIRLASITLGLKAIYYPHPRIALYAGAGPRLFLMMLHNDSPYVRSDDNEIGVGGGFDAGLWFFPIPCWPNVFFDLFADYSWRNMSIAPDEISSDDFNVNVSSLTGGLGLGVRF